MSAVDISLDLDSGIKNAIGELQLADKRVQLAIKRAVRKVLQWLSRRVASQLADAGKVSERVVKAHRRVAVKFGDVEGLVWVGLDPLPAHEGKVAYSRGSAGASVNGKTLKGAFVASIYAGGAKVWIRSARNRSFGHAVVHSRRRYKTFSGEVSHGRFPVELIGIDVEAMAKQDARLQASAMHRFETLLNQELNYALNVEKRNGR